MLLDINNLIVKVQRLKGSHFLGLIIFLQFVLHIPFFNLPPMGQHTWRQVAGHSQARNYYEEGNPLLYPRLDIRIEEGDKGEIYKEFPLLYWLIGQSYRITGFSNANARLGQFLTAIFLIFGSYRFARAMGLSLNQAKGFTFFLSFAPYFFYYSITLIPDLLALAWYLWGLALIIPYLREQKKWKEFFLGVICLVFASLSKATWIFFGLVLAYLFWESFIRTKNVKIIYLSFLTGGAILCSFALQYYHQITLYNAAPVERASETYLSAKAFPTDFRTIFSILNQAVGTWFFQLYVNLAALPIFFAGAYYGIKQKRCHSYAGRFWLFWLISFFIYFLLFFISFGPDGGYYLTPILPITAWISTKGLFINWKFPGWRHFFLICLFLIPIVMVVRVEKRWRIHRQVPVELLERAHEIQKLLPGNERILVMSDKGVIIFLYYLHRYGTTVPWSLKSEKLLDYKKKGFNWLVYFAETPLAHLNNYLQLIGKVGRFEIYKIKKQVRYNESRYDAKG